MIFFLKLFLKEEEIVDKIETALVKSFIENVDFKKIKGLSSRELEYFVAYFCVLFTESYSYVPSIRERVIDLSYKKCFRRAKWETSLIN